MKTDIVTALVGVFIMAAITFATRAFPFVVFRRHQPGPRFLRIQETLPALILPILVAYALKDVHWLEPYAAIRTGVAVLVVAGLHLWRRNPLLSIFGGTACYMAWVHIFVQS